MRVDRRGGVKQPTDSARNTGVRGVCGAGRVRHPESEADGAVAIFSDSVNDLLWFGSYLSKRRAI